MNKYIVSIPLVGAMHIEVEAQSEKKAKERAWDVYNESGEGAGDIDLAQPTMTCPQCGTEMDDFDGVGVLAHVAPMPDACGYCRHPSRDLIDGKWTCGICGDQRKDA